MRRLKYWSNEHKSLITVGIFELLFMFWEWTSFILFHSVLTSFQTEPFFSENWNAFLHVLPKIMGASWWNHYMWTSCENCVCEWQLNLNLLFHFTENGLSRYLDPLLSLTQSYIWSINLEYCMRSNLVALDICSFYQEVIF